MFASKQFYNEIGFLTFVFVLLTYVFETVFTDLFIPNYWQRVLLTAKLILQAIIFKSNFQLAKKIKSILNKLFLLSVSFL